MLESGLDQATGLRRIMPRRTGGVVPIVGVADQIDCTVHLVRAMADAVDGVTVVSDFPDLLDRLTHRHSTARIQSVYAGDHGGDLHLLTDLADPTVWTLVMVDDARLADGLGLDAHEALVLTGADDESLAASYVRIKTLVEGARVRGLCTVFGPGCGGAPARHGHARLLRTTRRFLGAQLSFAGCAPDVPVSGAYQRLAEGVLDWLGSVSGEAGWRPQ